MNISLPYGSSALELEIPRKNYLNGLFPKEVKGVDPSLEVQRALKNPIGSKKLSHLLSGKERVVILASDITRPSPSHILIPPLLKELNEAGVKDHQIKVIFSLGIHRPLTKGEMERLVGKEVFQRVQCLNHDPMDCQGIGVTSRGTPVQVFSEVLKADFIITTGNIDFHFFAGFSGGAKALCPGVCSRETIKANHRFLLQEGAVGGMIEGNPVREDLEEVAQLVGIDFMLNAILNEKKEVVKVVAGHIKKAHQWGINFIREIFTTEIREKAPIVITTPGGFPKDIDLYQTHKAMENASLAVEEGGILIVVAECRDGLGEEAFAKSFLTGKTPEELVDQLKEDFQLGPHKTSRIAGIHLKSPIYLVSQLPKDIKDQLFMRSFDTPKGALEEAFRVKGEGALVLAIPYGSSTLPIFKG